MAKKVNAVEPIIDASNYKKFIKVKVDGEVKGTGAEPRDYYLFPQEMYAPPSEMDLIPESEWDDRIDELEKTKTKLSDIRGDIPSLDQGPVGYCWAHSTAHCVTLLRAANHDPYVPLSAYMVAAIIKSGRDEGGWCGLSQKFLRETGISSQKLWPQGNRSLALDNAACRANAAKHKVTEEWVDLTREVYDQNLTFKQIASCLLVGTPVALDFEWWGHSVCGVDLVRIEKGSYGFRIWNSWSDSWGERGMGILRGEQAIPMGAVALRVTGASGGV